MLRHIFLADVRAGTPSDDVDELIAAWRSFPASIGEIRSFAAGRNVSSVDRRYAVVLVADFDDLESWQRFMDHPSHLAIRESISARVLEPSTRTTIQYVI